MSIHYSGLKFIRFHRQLESLRTGELVEPVHVRLKPTNRCGHHCWYCAYRASHLELGETMMARDQIPQEKMREIVEDLAAMQVQSVTFSGGGEPLSYPGLGEHVVRLGQAGIHVGAITNGSLLKDQLAATFAQYATWVRVSIDAWDDQSFADIRKVKVGEFSNVVRNMRQFAQLGNRCTLGVCFIITAENCNHVYDVCSLFKDLGVRHVKLSAVIVANDAPQNARYHDSIQAITAQQVDRARTLEDDTFQLIHHYHDLGNRFAIHFRQCAYMRFVTVIAADCNVYTCHDKAYNKAGLLGSIRDRSFREFWFSEENRQNILSFDPRTRCHHHCMVQKTNEMVQNYLDIDPEHGTFV